MEQQFVFGHFFCSFKSYPFLCNSLRFLCIFTTVSVIRIITFTSSTMHSIKLFKFFLQCNLEHIYEIRVIPTVPFDYVYQAIIFTSTYRKSECLLQPSQCSFYESHCPHAICKEYHTRYGQTSNWSSAPRRTLQCYSYAELSISSALEWIVEDQALCTAPKKRWFSCPRYNVYGT